MAVGCSPAKLGLAYCLHSSQLEWRNDRCYGSLAFGLDFLRQNGGKRGSWLFGNEAGARQGRQWRMKSRISFGGQCRAFSQQQPGGEPDDSTLWTDVSRPLPQGRGVKSVSSFAGVEFKATDTERRIKSRRRQLLLSSLALIIGLADPYDVGGPLLMSESRDALSATVDTRSASVNEAESRTSDAEERPETPDDVKSWYRYRGEGFVLRIPPGYEDMLESGKEESRGSSPYGEKAKEKPFAARFASPDRNEVLSIVVKRSSQLRLSFFEATDISDFGNIKDAAATFVPAGAKLVSARIINSKSSRVPRSSCWGRLLPSPNGKQAVQDSNSLLPRSSFRK